MPVHRDFSYTELLPDDFQAPRSGSFPFFFSWPYKTRQKWFLYFKRALRVREKACCNATKINWDGRPKQKFSFLPQWWYFINCMEIERRRNRCESVILNSRHLLGICLAFSLFLINMHSLSQGYCTRVRKALCTRSTEMLCFDLNKKNQSKFFYSYWYIIIVHSSYVWLAVGCLIWIPGSYTTVVNS